MSAIPGRVEIEEINSCDATASESFVWKKKKDCNGSAAEGQAEGIWNRCYMKSGAIRFLTDWKLRAKKEKLHAVWNPRSQESDFIKKMK